MTVRSYGSVASPELLLEFLRAFSRFEFALKATGFAQGDERGVEPAWDRFARAISPRVEATQDPEFIAAVEYLVAQPPKKQILDGGRLSWRNVPPDAGLSRAEKALLMVRRVRNNLFHGGKYLSDETADTTRDRRLVESSLTVLRECVRIVPEVQDAYES